MIAESPLAHFLLSSRDFQWREGEDRPRLGQDIQLFHVFAFSGAVEFWGCSSRMLRGLLPRRAVGARDWESPGPNFELAVGEANSWIRRTDAPPVDDSVEMVIAPAVLPGGCLICEGLRNLPESENPLAPTSGEFWSSIDAVADDEQSQVWMSLRRRGWPVKVVAAPGEAKGEPGMDRRTTYAVDLEDAFGDTGPKRARRNRKPDLRVHASHAPRDRIAVYLGFISRKFRKGGGMSEGGVVTIPDGYWPFFKQLLQAGAEQTGISLSLTEPPVPADEADLVYLQHHSMLWGRFRKVLNYTKALEVEGDHQEELLAFRDRVLSRYGRYADPEAYLTLRISEWHGGLHVGTPDDPQFGAITMFGKVPLLLAALERAIADCAREKGYDHGGDPSGEPGEEDPDVGIE